MGVPDQADRETGRSSFIVYVDESGDHSLEKIDDEYPLFVLAFCAFYQDNYVDKVVSAVERLKFRQFGHDIVVLHERDIRRELAPFKFRSRAEKEAFLDELTGIPAQRPNQPGIRRLEDKISLPWRTEECWKRL